MAYQVKKPAAGDVANTGMPKTPAPTRQAPPDAVSEVRNPTAQSYGENGPKNNASRTNPGEVVESDLARNLRESSDDGEDVLGQIIRGGAHSVDMGPHPDVDWQTRRIDPGNVSNHPAMGDANAGGAPSGKVPPKLGYQEFDPASVRKPGE